MRLLETIATIKNLRERAESSRKIDYYQRDGSGAFAEKAVAMDSLADDLEDYMEQRLGWSGKISKELSDRLGLDDA